MPLIRIAAKHPAGENIISRSLIVNISSTLGSLAGLTKETQKYYGYRMSKVTYGDF